MKPAVLMLVLASVLLGIMMGIRDFPEAPSYQAIAGDLSRCVFDQEGRSCSSCPETVVQRTGSPSVDSLKRVL